MENRPGVRVTTLKQEEIEALLTKEFGEKINPIDEKALAKQKRLQRPEKESRDDTQALAGENPPAGTQKG